MNDSKDIKDVNIKELDEFNKTLLEHLDNYENSYENSYEDSDDEIDGKPEYNDKQILSYIDEWVYSRIDKNFKFREHQKECIFRIIKNIIYHNYQNYIVEAPTGSGKSLINIISAGVLADYFNITSYILVSDLFLWEQYESFIKKHKRTGIAALKGQSGNYKCTINGEDMKNADCRMSGISWAALFNPTTCENLGYQCAYTCEYVKARKKAIKAKVCIMTYQLFLFIMNNPMYNRDQKGCPIFSVHDVLFCDECHNIPEIVQLQYSPTILYEDFDKLKSLYYRTTSYQPSLFDVSDNQGGLWDGTCIYSKYKTWEELEKVLHELWDRWTCVESRKDEDIASAQLYLDILIRYTTIVNEIKNNIYAKKENKEPLTKDDIKMFKLCSWHENYMCHWNDFCSAIAATGEDYFLKDINIPETNKKIGNKDICVTFKCTKEDYLVWMFLLQRAQHKVMLSATVGTKEAFDERMGFQYESKTDWDHPNAIVNQSFMETIPSTFDFSQSPVFFFNKFKMSFREREISFRHLKTVIYSICNTKFKGQKGMIQTGSYEFAKRLYNDAPLEIKERMLVYNGSREKMTIVQIHKLSQDTILVGPTLNTGIDLPGDDCRFIIILKVPYPTLMDKLVNERNKLYPLWYNSHTSNEIIQGIGRGVRFNGDWCVTYILDACFNTLYRSTKYQYPSELQNRIKII
jgi:Rad3-related DNA helicase